MKITKRLVVFLSLFLLVAAHHVVAQNQTIVQERVEVSRSLSGHVSVAQTEEPIDNVTVELCRSDWNTVLMSTKTDKDGHFSFENQPGKLFYIRFSSPGFNPFQLRVKVKKGAKRDLAIHLYVAT